jgi:hypothetical protein
VMVVTMLQVQLDVIQMDLKVHLPAGRRCIV